MLSSISIFALFLNLELLGQDTTYVTNLINSVGNVITKLSNSHIADPKLIDAYAYTLGLLFAPDSKNPSSLDKCSQFNGINYVVYNNIAEDNFGLQNYFNQKIKDDPNFKKKLLSFINDFPKSTSLYEDPIFLSQHGVEMQIPNNGVRPEDSYLATINESIDQTYLRCIDSIKDLSKTYPILNDYLQEFTSIYTKIKTSDLTIPSVNTYMYAMIDNGSYYDKYAKDTGLAYECTPYHLFEKYESTIFAYLNSPKLVVITNNGQIFEYSKNEKNVTSKEISVEELNKILNHKIEIVDPGFHFYELALKHTNGNKVEAFELLALVSNQDSYSNGGDEDINLALQKINRALLAEYAESLGQGLFPKDTYLKEAKAMAVLKRSLLLKLKELLPDLDTNIDFYPNISTRYYHYIIGAFLGCKLAEQGFLNSILKPYIPTFALEMCVPLIENNMPNLGLDIGYFVNQIKTVITKESMAAAMPMLCSMGYKTITRQIRFTKLTKELYDAGYTHPGAPRPKNLKMSEEDYQNAKNELDHIFANEENTYRLHLEGAIFGAGECASSSSN